MQEQEKREPQLHPDQVGQATEATPVQADEIEQTDPLAPVPGPTSDEKLIAAEARASEMHDAFLRAKAESENMRRRAQEDIARAHKYAIESFAEALVPVKDSLEMALKVETPSIESLKEGVEMTLKQLSSAFEKGRLVEINPQPGEKLDPMKHQAISMVPADQEANTIVSVLQKGYLIADRLLRPALVTVSQEKAGKSA